MFIITTIARTAEVAPCLTDSLKKYVAHEIAFRSAQQRHATRCLISPLSASLY